MVGIFYPATVFALGIFRHGFSIWSFFLLLADAGRLSEVVLPLPGRRWVLSLACSPLLLPPRAGCDYLLLHASDLTFWWWVTLFDVNDVMDTGGPTLSRPKLNHHFENVMRGSGFRSVFRTTNCSLVVLISFFKPYSFKYAEILRWLGLALHVNFFIWGYHHDSMSLRGSISSIISFWQYFSAIANVNYRY